MRHVLEHIADPLSFLEGAKEANGGHGTVYIEVPCFDWILRSRAWFDVFYEHVNYFRLADFGRIFGRIHESGHLFGGQYLYVVAELSSLRAPLAGNRGEAAHVPEDFFASIDRCVLAGASSPQCVVWGGAAKGVMFAHHVLARGLVLDCAIDINPAKQGKFLASSGLPVLSPTAGLARLDRGAKIFVMNSNYIAEIEALCGSDFHCIALQQA